MKNMASQVFSNQALLTKSNGDKVDRRIMACLQCTNKYPLNCIGLIQTQKANQQFTASKTGTAFLISDYLAVTSGHLFFDTNPLKKEILQIPPKKFYLGLLGDISAQTERFLDQKTLYQIQEYKTHPQFQKIMLKIIQLQTELQKKQKQQSFKPQQRTQLKKRLYDLAVESQRYDYAILRLSRPALLPRYMQLTRQYQSSYGNVKIQGYQVKENANSRTFKQLYHNGPVEQVHDYSIYYNVDTLPQQSGSPVLYQQNGDIKVIAIHKGYASRSALNAGTRITVQLRKQIQKWAKQMNCSLTSKSNINYQENSTNQLLKQKDLLITQLRQLVTTLQEQLVKKEDRMQNFRQHIQYLQKQIKRLKQHVKSGISQQSQVSSVKSGQVPFVPQIKFKIPFVWDTTTKFADCFAIQGKKAKRIKDDKKQYQITAQHPISQISTTTFRFINYGGKNSICLGILKANRKQEQWSGWRGYKQSVGYWSAPSTLWGGQGLISVDGDKKIGWDSSLFVEKGGLLTMKVDLAQMKITYIKNKNEARYTYQLPLHFRKTPLFVFAVMMAKDGTVQIIQ